ncbi:PLP-dependent aminotransferase family protein [Streptomyces sp. NBRC 109706]|uniref:aminotransferase-like domain-containing protein n=1 Tax=Streptomyces sp. NBRC 109706 TaxID=1550035 RepID=UPI000782E873|nr:PLP-dependent aminotransferase family protein [Streptomyces sp. NBRC 109706]
MVGATNAAERPVLARRMATMAPSAIGSVLRLGDSTGVLSLAGGLPADEGLASPEITAVVGEVLAGASPGLQYGVTHGSPALCAWIAARLRADLGVTVDGEELIITQGSQQGIDLVCKALLDPGDIVVTDSPSYIGALQVFRLFEADVRPVPLAADPELTELADRLAAGLRPRLVYVVPNYSNPTGATLDERQRRRLADLADRYGFHLVEDDPYRDIWLSDRPPEAASLAGLSDRALHLGSFSKVLFPGCRVGYLTAPPALLPALRVVRQAADLGNSELLQRVVHALLDREGFFDRRLTRLRALYRRRRSALTGELRHQLPEARFETPQGGFFVWARLGPRLDTAALLPVALRHGVSYVPGAEFYPADPDRTTARLAFSCLPPERAGEAAARLAAAVREASGSGREAGNHR